MYAPLTDDLFHYKESGLDNLYLTKDAIKEYDDGSYKILNAKALQQSIAELLTDLPRMLTGKEFRYLRLYLKYSQKVLAQELAVDEQTIRRYEKEETTSLQSDLILRSYVKETIYGSVEVKKLREHIAKTNSIVDFDTKYIFELTENNWVLKDKVA